MLGVSGLFCRFYFMFDGKILVEKNVDPDQTFHYGRLIWATLFA